MHYKPSNFESKHRVEVIVQMWDYIGKFVVEIVGNTEGLKILEAAPGYVYQMLPVDNRGVTFMKLKNNKGGSLLCEDEENEGDDWIEGMVVSVRILERRLL